MHAVVWRDIISISSIETMKFAASAEFIELMAGWSTAHSTPHTRQPSRLLRRLDRLVEVVGQPKFMIKTARSEQLASRDPLVPGLAQSMRPILKLSSHSGLVIFKMKLQLVIHIAPNVQSALRLRETLSLQF